MALYVVKQENGELAVQGFVNQPEKYEAKLKDKSLQHKKIKLIDKPLLNPDGTEQTDLEGNVITEKVAVLDEVAQAAFEAEQAAQAKAEADKIKAEKDKLDEMKLKAKDKNIPKEISDVLEYILERL